ncbi:MDR family MFS transporter [Cellulomonas sp. P22]|uniref:MDR family MFS transporter n=1 Tax=Cellulomonas sp. P22 TaxID=3373189 RepID=UPI00379A5179
MSDVQLREETPAGAFSPAIETEKATGRVGPVIAVLMFSALIMILNETVLSVALPSIMGDFEVTAGTAQWLTTGFMLMMAVVIPTTGYLLQRFTTRTLFSAALLLFIVGTALCGIAPTFALILLGRIVQACGTAIILPLLMTTTLTTVPAWKRGAVMGLNSVVISVAPAIGPTISGIVVEALSWRWVFGLMLPLGAIVFVCGLFMIKATHEVTRPRLDVGSVVLSVFGFGGIVYGLSSIEALLDGAAAPVVALVIGVLGLVAFVRRQTRLQRTGSSLLDLRPFAVPAFRNSVIILMVVMATLLGTVVVLPIYLQMGMGVSVLTTGLLMLPGGLAQGVLAPFVGRIYDKVGPRPIVIPGAILLCGGQLLLSTIGADTSLGVVVAWHVVFCLGLSLLMTPLMTISLSALPRELYAHGSAILNTLQQLAGAAGTALLVAALTIGAAAASGSDAEMQTVGTRHAFILGSCIGLIAVITAPFVKRLRTDA